MEGSPNARPRRGRVTRSGRVAAAGLSSLRYPPTTNLENLLRVRRCNLIARRRAPRGAERSVIET